MAVHNRLCTKSCPQCRTTVSSIKTYHGQWCHDRQLPQWVLRRSSLALSRWQFSTAHWQLSIGQMKLAPLGDERLVKQQAGALNKLELPPSPTQPPFYEFATPQSSNTRRCLLNWHLTALIDPECGQRRAFSHSPPSLAKTFSLFATPPPATYIRAFRPFL